MPVSIAPRSSASFQVVFKPDAALTFTGSITINPGHKGGGATLISVSGAGTAVASAQTYLLSSSASNLSFGNTLVGSSASQAITLTNAGTGSVNISQVAASGAGFKVSGFSAGVTLASGQSLPLTASFAPASTGAAAGSIRVVSNATNSPLAMSLSGTGVQPQISVIPSSVSFGNVTVGVTNSQTLTIKNPGTAALSVTQASLSGTGFTSSGFTLPLSVPPGVPLPSTWRLRRPRPPIIRAVSPSSVTLPILLSWFRSAARASPPRSNSPHRLPRSALEA